MSKHRGSVDWLVDGITYTLRLPIEQHQALEARLGVGLVEMLGRMARNQYGTTQLNAIIAFGLRGGGMRNLRNEDVYRIMDNARMQSCIDVAGRLLAQTLDVGPTDEADETRQSDTPLQ